LKERRVDARFRQPVLAHARAVLRPGHAIALIDLSAGGALIQGNRALRPGSRVQIHLTIGGRSMWIPAQVLRCAVASLDAEFGVQYHGAVKFTDRCTSLWESSTRTGYSVPAGVQHRADATGHAIPVE
jgi:hypothetical protein